MSAIGQNPYQPPEPETPAPIARDRSAALAEQSTPQPAMPTAGRRVTSTIICTGGIVWCLMTLAVFLETLLSGAEGQAANLKAELLVWIFFGAVGISIFMLGLCIRRNQKQRTFVMLLVILVLCILFPFIAIATDEAASALR